MEKGHESAKNAEEKEFGRASPLTT